MSGNTLTLGGGGQAPGWSADPLALGPFGSGGFLLLKYAANSTLSWNAGEAENNLRAFTMAVYVKLTSAPTGSGYWVLRLTGGARDTNLRLFDNGEVDLACGLFGGNTLHVRSTTSLANGGEYFVAVSCGLLGGDTARVYVNGALEGTGVLPFDTTAFTSQPSLFLGSNTSTFTNEPGFPGYIGRTVVYDGQLSDDQVATLYAEYQGTYSGLP